MVRTIPPIIALLCALGVAPATAADADDAQRNSAPRPLDQAPAVHAPSDARPDEEEDPGAEMLERWRVEDRVERREDHREERYEAEPVEPAPEGGAASDDAVAPESEDLSDHELEDEPAIDDDQL